LPRGWLTGLIVRENAHCFTRNINLVLTEFHREVTTLYLLLVCSYMSWWQLFCYTFYICTLYSAANLYYGCCLFSFSRSGSNWLISCFAILKSVLTSNFFSRKYFRTIKNARPAQVPAVYSAIGS
jgi:hypothetical protein